MGLGQPGLVEGVLCPFWDVELNDLSDPSNPNHIGILNSPCLSQGAAWEFNLNNPVDQSAGM